MPPTRLLPFVLILAACEGGELAPVIEPVSSPIINGLTPSSAGHTIPPVVAVYHDFKRPCSGIQVSRDGWVLTAAHCVTQRCDPPPAAPCSANDPRRNFVTGPVLPLSALKAARPRTLNPGLTPPTNAMTASEVHRPGGEIDLALIKFPGLADSNFKGLQSTAFHFGHPSELTGKLSAWGYGRSVEGDPDGEVEDGTTGAGTLRWGLFDVQPVASPWEIVTVEPDPTVNTQIWRGDSGGPLLRHEWFRWDPFTETLQAVPIIVAITSRSAMTFSEEVSIHPVVSFLNQHLGWFYIRNPKSWNGTQGYLDVQWDSAAAGAPAWLWPLTDTRAQHWQYDVASKAIRNQNGNCLDVQWNSAAERTPVWMWPCDGGPAQQWRFTYPNLQIVNANGKCLSAESTSQGSTLMIKTCSTSDSLQKWTIAATP